MVELPNGDIALKRVEEDEETLVNISFSDQSEFALNELKMLVARAMIEAGIEAYTELAIQQVEDEIPAVLH